MSKLGELGAKLHTGEVSYDFIGKRKFWFIVSAVLILISVTGLAVRGLSLGIEFKGGVEFQATVKLTDSTVEGVRDAVRSTGVEAASEPVVTTVGNDKVRVQTRPLEQTELTEVREAIAQETGVANDAVNYSQIGASWGDQITTKAIWALGVFLVLVFGVIWFYFREPKASMAAILALVHDVLITVGVYALIGFDVTPATVIGVLTILGYSLYDTVVVFDKIRENTRGITGSNRQTYSDATNLAVNQTVVRSINTTIIALLPVTAILVVGVGVLGSGPLKDLSLALFVGIAAGAYSSIFIAPALLAAFKEREPGMQALAKRVTAKRAQTQRAAKAEAKSEQPVTVGGGPVQDDVPPPASERKPARKTAAAPSVPSRPMKATGSGRPQPSRKSRSKRRK
jgi:preprotein translocase subunit SecF